MPEEKPWNENKVLQLNNTDFHRQKEFFLGSLFPSCPSCPSWFTYFDGGFRTYEGFEIEVVVCYNFLYEVKKWSNRK
jgi:hypothetical protein